MRGFKCVLFLIAASLFFCSSYAWVCTEVANYGAVMFGGYGFSNCKSNELSPTIIEGDMLGVIQKKKYQEGDIVIFRKLGRAYLDRITGYQDGKFSFSNTSFSPEVSAASSMVTEQDIVGEVVSAVPYLGSIFSYIQTFPGLCLLWLIMLSATLQTTVKED